MRNEPQHPHAIILSRHSLIYRLRSLPDRNALCRVSAFNPSSPAISAMGRSASRHSWTCSSTGGVNTAGPRQIRGSKKPAMPFSRYSFTLRRTLILLTPKSPADLSLAGAAVAIQLAGEHAEALQIVNGMREHRQVARDIGDGRALAQKIDDLLFRGMPSGNKGSWSWGMAALGCGGAWRS